MSSQILIPRGTGTTEKKIHVPGTPILSSDGVSFEYEATPALVNITFELISGERMAVVGPNGAGKSTLFKVIAGLMQPSRGSVKIFGADPGGHICIAYLPQRAQVDWTFPVTVSDVVMMGRTRHIGYFRRPGENDQKIVQTSLATVGLSAYSQRQISELSGGQQQRMFIARALAQEAELILMDEPGAGLDNPSLIDLFTVLDTLKDNGVTVMLALHDLKLASDHFDRVMFLNLRLVGIGTPREVFVEEILRQTYGDHLQILKRGNGVEMYEDSCCGDEGGTHG